MTSESYKKRNLSKHELAKAVALKMSVKFVLDKDLRNQLIVRMRPSCASKLLNKKGIIHDPESHSLDILRQYLSVDPKNLDIFAEYLGLLDEYNDSLYSKEKTKDVILALPQYKLYPYQRTLVNDTNKAISSGKQNRLLIHLPTGAGKTRTAMAVICNHLNQNEDGLVVWLADTEELCSQATSEFNKAWSSLGNRDVSIYSYFSDSDKNLSSIQSGVLVASLQRMNSRKNNDDAIYLKKLFSRVSLVIFDEAHKAIAETYKAIVNDFVDVRGNAFLIGLSATPGRKLDDETEDMKLARFFDNNKLTMNVDGYRSPVQYLIDEQFLAEPIYHPIDYEGSSNQYYAEGDIKHYRDVILKELSQIKSRNDAIINRVIQEHQQNSSIIVFACSTEHAEVLADTLNCLGYPAYSLTSKSDDTTSRRFKINAYKNRKVRIMINYGILATGFDAPCTKVAIIARPTDSLVLYSQMSGRAMRGLKSGGNKQCKIYTVHDNIPEFTSLPKAFEHWDSHWNEL